MIEFIFLAPWNPHLSTGFVSLEDFLDGTSVLGTSPSSPIGSISVTSLYGFLPSHLNLGLVMHGISWFDMVRVSSGFTGRGSIFM